MRVEDVSDFCKTVVGHRVAPNQRAGLSQGHVACGGRCFFGSVYFDPISANQPVPLLDSDIALEYRIGLGDF